MKVSFVNYKRQWLKHAGEYAQAINNCLEDGDLILRQQLEDFESQLATKTGTKYAIGVNSCTDALFFSLKAHGIGPGDEVILPSHTFIATAAVVYHLGALPVLVDINDDHNISCKEIRKNITPKTRAIIPVHLNGRMCNMYGITSIAQDYNLLVIEDAAQALGATFKGKQAGSWGDIGCFSFYPSKTLGAFGDAGAVVTNNGALYMKIKSLRNHGYPFKKTGEHTDWGYSSRMDNIQAAVLSAKMKYLEQWVERRREIALMYHWGLASIEFLTLPLSSESRLYHDTYQVYEIEAEDRNWLEKYLQSKGIETMRPWGGKAIHQYNLKGTLKGDLSKTDALFKKVLQLPMYPELTNEEVDYVTQTVKSFYD